MQINSKLPFSTNIIASGLFTGYIPLAPGTVGSGLAFIIFFLFQLNNSAIFLPIIILTFIVGTMVSNIAEKKLGKDPSIVVIDEIVGMWISLLYLPNNILIWILAFVVFRILDILKPFPCRKVEKLSGGLGIMLDDIIAGIYTNIILQIIYSFI